MNVKCTERKDCYRQRIKLADQYKKHFEGVEAAFHLIFKGSSTDSAFGDNFLGLIKTHYKCDVGKLTDYMKGDN